MCLKIKGKEEEEKERKVIIIGKQAAKMRFSGVHFLMILTPLVCNALTISKTIERKRLTNLLHRLELVLCSLAATAGGPSPTSPYPSQASWASYPLSYLCSPSSRFSSSVSYSRAAIDVTGVHRLLTSCS